ncbi:hypothetical protein QYE76_001788 [Lolium multiflorum]|uniref:Reverse transcriptase Ty1/copia-type domain-containing protein n=1 Tax=Lolium multiflorum TaxID=4521 RepID=A0AAD8RM09_LOLMU|nr:hypothetical protein QYE76_001788 [Lolium multiflorum]
MKSTPRGLFCHEASRRPKERRSGATGRRHTRAARPKGGPRGPSVWGPVTPPDLPFRLHIVFVAKPPVPRATIRKTFRDAAAANPISGIQEIASGTLPERGFISRRTLHRHGRRSDEFHVGAGIPGVAPHYISPPSTFNVLLGSYWDQAIDQDEHGDHQSSAVPEDVPVPPAPVTEEANANDHETSSEIATEPRRSTRERTTPDWYDSCLNFMIVDNNDEDPATYEEAMVSPDSNKWQEAMKSEMGSMYDNKVWTLVDLPDSRKAVENKWIFKRKTDADGNITVYKARLVAKGFRQIQGVDYDETFSHVAKLKSMRILLAIAAIFDYEIWQMDVKTVFLNGDIEEELYMVQPKGFVDPKNADKV